MSGSSTNMTRALSGNAVQPAVPNTASNTCIYGLSRTVSAGSAVRGSTAPVEARTGAMLASHVPPGKDSHAYEAKFEGDTVVPQGMYPSEELRNVGSVAATMPHVRSDGSHAPSSTHMPAKATHTDAHLYGSATGSTALPDAAVADKYVQASMYAASGREAAEASRAADAARNLEQQLEDENQRWAQEMKQQIALNDDLKRLVEEHRAEITRLHADLAAAQTAAVHAHDARHAVAAASARAFDAEQRVQSLQAQLRVLESERESALAALAERERSIVTLMHANFAGGGQSGTVAEFWSLTEALGHMASLRDKATKLLEGDTEGLYDYVTRGRPPAGWHHRTRGVMTPHKAVALVMSMLYTPLIRHVEDMLARRRDHALRSLIGDTPDDLVSDWLAVGTTGSRTAEAATTGSTHHSAASTRDGPSPDVAAARKAALERTGKSKMFDVTFRSAMESMFTVGFGWDTMAAYAVSNWIAGLEREELLTDAGFSALLNDERALAAARSLAQRTLQCAAWFIISNSEARLSADIADHVPFSRSDFKYWTLTREAQPASVWPVSPRLMLASNPSRSWTLPESLAAKHGELVLVIKAP